VPYVSGIAAEHNCNDCPAPPACVGCSQDDQSYTSKRSVSHVSSQAYSLWLFYRQFTDWRLAQLGEYPSCNVLFWGSNPGGIKYFL